MTLRIGLSNVPSWMVKISRRRKDKHSLTWYITAEEAENDKGDNVVSNSKSSVFDKLQASTPQQHPSIFSKMGKDKTPKPCMFQRLKGDK